MVKEYYLWAFPLAGEHDEDIRAFFDTLRSASLQAAVSQLPGYECDESGTTIDPGALLQT